MQPVPLQTRWAATVRPENALPEYPRPQMVRKGWQNLNGLWRYAITAGDVRRPPAFDGSILVPFPLESALSGVKTALGPDQELWYQRTINVAPPRSGGRILLHFGAVDYSATVYVNDREVGSHTGGYQSFTFDITSALKPGDNDLLVKVKDPTDAGPNPHGKQTSRPQGIFYTATSGIWQTVWLEQVPATYIASLRLTSDVDTRQLDIDVALEGKSDDTIIELVARNGRKKVAKLLSSSSVASLPIATPRLWSPSDPFLYDLQVRLLRRGKVIDEVTSYFGMRKVGVKRDPAGIPRIYLNGEYTYNLGTLDQGFWPDGLYTAPTDAALRFDVETIKAMGFNTIRKHVKVEPDRWYYHCDRLGIIVWQDLVPPGAESKEARDEFERELQATLSQLHNHPSITTWVMFNEGWGAYDQNRLEGLIKQIDPSRLLNGHSGPLVGIPGAIQQAGDSSDLTDRHTYPDPFFEYSDTGKAQVLGEFGGLGVLIDAHRWNAEGWGWANIRHQDLVTRYTAMTIALMAFEDQGLSGSIYTQPFDVESESNGLMTYDRAFLKMPLGEIWQINSMLVPGGVDYARVAEGYLPTK